MTETEHHALRDGKDYSWNNDLRYGSEIDVSRSPANEKGFHDVFSNVWQWCEDHFHPLQGSVPHPYYDDFSVSCYDGQHQMILGGSFVSTGNESSIWARFHFRPHFMQHVGFRLVRSEDNERFDDSFKTQVVFPQVVELPIACAELVRRFSTGKDRALDLGCAVGRTTFELAYDFKEIIGIDYSHQFIDAARHLQLHGTLKYNRKDQGMQVTSLVASVHPSIDRNRVRFEVGDACVLSLTLSDFDAVVLANVLCRLKRMQGVNDLVKPGGILVMTTPFSWLPEYTPPENWLNSVEDIAAILTDFELVHQQNLPFLLREHRRKFEYIIPLATVWKCRVSAN